MLVIGMSINPEGVCLTYNVLHDLCIVISYLVLRRYQSKMISATMSRRARQYES